MNKSTIATIIYVLGILFGALVLNMWSAETVQKLWGNDLDCVICNFFILLKFKNK